MTKHCCDRCGREILALHEVTIQSIPCAYAATSDDWPSVAVRATLLKGELCDDCLLWLKANWPFKVKAEVPSSSVTKTLTPKEWQQATPTTPLPDSGSSERPPFETTIAGTIEDLSLVDLSPKPFVVEVHIDGNHLSVKTPLASWEIDLKEATHDPHPA